MHERAARNKNSGQLDLVSSASGKLELVSPASGQLELVSPASCQLELATSQGQKEVPERILIAKNKFFRIGNI